MGHVAASENYNSTIMGYIHLTLTQIVVDRANWVSLKGEIGLASAELVRLYTYAGLLMRCMEYLQQKCTGLESLQTKWRLQRTGAVYSSTSSAFCRVRTRCPLLKEVDDRVVVFKDERVEL